MALFDKKTKDIYISNIFFKCCNETWCIYLYIYNFQLNRKGEITILHNRTVSKGPTGPLSSGAWNTDQL